MIVATSSTHTFSSSASVRMISTVKIYFSLFFSLSGHVYSQFPEKEISKLPTSRSGHPKEKQDGKVSLLPTLNKVIGVTIEPTGNSEKSEPQMGFEPTTPVIYSTDALTTELLETLC